jgi:hypothetical protein
VGRSHNYICLCMACKLVACERTLMACGIYNRSLLQCSSALNRHNLNIKLLSCLVDV